MIGHMKNDGRLTRCPLKGTDGDAVFAVLCGCGYNIRMILTKLCQGVGVAMAPARMNQIVRMSA
jgi:IS5 family transposase